MSAGLDRLYGNPNECEAEGCGEPAVRPVLGQNPDDRYYTCLSHNYEDAAGPQWEFKGNRSLTIAGFVNVGFEGEVQVGDEVDVCLENEHGSVQFNTVVRVNSRIYVPKDDRMGLGWDEDDGVKVTVHLNRV